MLFSLLLISLINFRIFALIIKCFNEFPGVVIIREVNADEVNKEHNARYDEQDPPHYLTDFIGVLLILFVGQKCFEG